MAIPTPLVNVSGAVDTLNSNSDPGQKLQAHEFLDNFQKTLEAWTTSFGLLQNAEVSLPAKVFAAVTLKGKIIYDLHQIPRESWSELRDSLFNALGLYGGGPKTIRTILCVCLVNLAIQMTEWKGVLEQVTSAFGNDSNGIKVILEFLHVLPEEVLEGRKILLSEDELANRSRELLQDNIGLVLTFLSTYSERWGRSRTGGANEAILINCINSWSREIPIERLISDGLIDIVFESLWDASTEDEAVDCICSVLRETRDVDECMGSIGELYPRVIGLMNKLGPDVRANSEDVWENRFRIVSRILAEAGEHWVLLIARNGREFGELVKGILDCAILGTDRDSIRYTFNFWYELKQYLTLNIYSGSRNEFRETYANLVEAMIRHLEYPSSSSGDDGGVRNGGQEDLFDGDREAEETFREFRHLMGDVLKDCCEVIGSKECLEKMRERIECWMNIFKEPGKFKWQEIEAILFSLRAMGRVIPINEGDELSRILPMILELPDHDKIRFQVIMALGRYTEWTAFHVESLEEQFSFIMKSFNHSCGEVVRAAALSFRFFCQDCSHHLSRFIHPMHEFYHSTLGRLGQSSQEELTEGVALVLSMVDIDQIYRYMKLYCDPLIKSYLEMARSAVTVEEKTILADQLSLITIFIQFVKPEIPSSHTSLIHPAVQYCQEINPVLSAIVENFSDFLPIIERICKCWRYMILSYRTAILPLLPELVTRLILGFQNTKQSGFLWTTDAVIRELNDSCSDVPQSILDDIFRFYQTQASTFFNIFQQTPLIHLGDTIEDFFRLSIDVLLYHAEPFFTSTTTPPSATTNNEVVSAAVPLYTEIFQAAITSLSLHQVDPIMAVLHFLRDFVSYALPYPPSSQFPRLSHTAASESTELSTPPHIRQSVITLLESPSGELLVQKLLAGMLFNFSRDCIPDASGVLLVLFHVIPRQTFTWTQSTLLHIYSLSPTAASVTSATTQQQVTSNDTSTTTVSQHGSSELTTNAPATDQSVADREISALLRSIDQKLSSSSSDPFTGQPDISRIRSILQDFTASYRRRHLAPREGLNALDPQKLSFQE